MEVIIILLPLAVLLGLVFIGGFIWMTYRGQYDDLNSPKYKMLLDDYTKKDKGDELNGN